MLATNVAETSLTVPGIRYVVDTGVARISRYSVRTKVQRLPIEPISQASANQRSGRCGRVSEGIAIRLYSEEDFEARPEFTDPEILRTNLASVILQMASLRLGDIARFPFVEPPDRRNVKAGTDLLEELGAISTTVRSRPAVRTGEAASACTEGRPAPGPAPDRPAAGPDDPGGRAPRLPARRPRHRRRPVHPGPARASRGAAGAGRPAARPLQARVERLPHLAQPVAPHQAAAARAVLERVPPDVQARAPQLHAHPRVAGLRVPAAPGGQGDEARGRPPVGHPRRGRHPPGAALRPAQPHRRARGAREGQAGGAPPDAGVPRCPQRPLRGLPRQRAEGAQPRLPDERRAGRDLAPVGPAERRHQARVGRAPRRPPGQADLLGAALVPQACRGDGPRAGHAVRRPAGRRPPRAVRPDRRAARPRALHPARPRPAGVGLPAPVPRREHPPPRGGRGARAPGPTPRHRRRRGDPLRVLRRPRRRRRRQRAALRPVVEARAAEEARPAHLRPRDAHPRHGRGGARPRLPDPVARQRRGRADLPDQLPLRARRRRRRAHHRRPRRHPQPHRGRRLLVAGARAARGAGHRADPLAAEEPPRRDGARTQHGPRVPRRDAAGGRAAARRPRAVRAEHPEPRHPPRGVGLVQGPGPPATDLPGGDREGRRGRSRQGPRRAQGAAAAHLRAGDGRRRVRLGRDRHRPDGVDLRHGRGVLRAAPRGPRGPGLPGPRRRGGDGRPAGARHGRRGRGAPPARRTTPRAPRARSGRPRRRRARRGRPRPARQARPRRVALPVGGRPPRRRARRHRRRGRRPAPHRA